MYEKTRLHFNFSFTEAIANVLIMLAILWVAATWFSEYVWFDKPGTMVLVAVLYGVVTTAVFIAIITAAAVAFVYYRRSKNTLLGIGIVLAVIAIVLSDVIALIVLDNWMSGFTVNGFWPKVWLVIIKGIATPTTRNKREG